MLNRYIREDAGENQKNLSVAWIDYRKVHDSIPHEGITKVQQVYKVPVEDGWHRPKRKTDFWGAKMRRKSAGGAGRALYVQFILDTSSETFS